eukprot:CAMPEP_0170498052 /NCGR_PEP_ID=MMETSP0208-20121228/26661_1 /TAXON_ID=197538 /ORGANISM="Strombidium inclinatum, Strain S3" /LENGTH=69 /DNA_ID=CAMNT_0010775103 /DNA_START=357 /DNA_END=566 /DNA_ORIENTATION=+
MRMEDIEGLTGVKYNSIRNIMRTYRRFGMTNKKLILCPRKIKRMPVLSKKSGRLHARSSAQAQIFSEQA